MWTNLCAGSAVLLHSKAFDPKVFLSTVHPNATFKDLNMGMLCFDYWPWESAC